MPVSRSSHRIDANAEDEARCNHLAKAAGDLRKLPAFRALLHSVATAFERATSLFVRPPIVERVEIEDGVVCVSRYVAERLVDRRRIRANGLSVDRHVDKFGQCARVELIGADRIVQIAGHETPSERDRLLKNLISALNDEGAIVEVRTVVGRALEATDASRRRRSAMLRRLSVIALTAAALQAGLMWRWSQQPSDARPAPLREPSFRLTSTSGAIVDETTMRGRPYAAFFGFTQCPQVCPATLLELTHAIQSLGPEAANLAIVFVTLDPERDTPKALSDFIAPFDGRVIALTGSQTEIARAAQAFRVYFRKSPLDGGGYTIDHTTLVYLVDRHGRVRDGVSLMDHRGMATRRLRAFLHEETDAAG